MINTIKHAFNLLLSKTRDLGLVKRSGHWPWVEKDFLSKNPACAACGGKDRLNVHHIHPFHIHPELELDEKNLITLCMGKKECHLQLGHLGNFKLYNPNIKVDAAKALANPKEMDEIITKAKTHAKVN